MAEVAPPAAPTTPTKPKKNLSKPRSKSSPGVKELILKIVTNSKDRKGVSYIYLKKALAAQGYDVVHNSAHVKRAVKSMLEKKTLTQIRGNGVSGSFKVCTVPAKPKNAVTVARVKAKVAKKPAGAKSASKKAVVPKKSKVTKASPRKGKMPAPKKQPVKKVATSPKKKVIKKAAAPKKAAATSKKPVKKVKPRVKPAAKPAVKQ